MLRSRLIVTIAPSCSFLFPFYISQEIGLQLRASNPESAVERQSSREDTVVFFRPPRYYEKYVDQLVREKILLPAPNPGANRQYSFIISDSYGDGLCCDSVGNLEPGYTLWEGDPEEGKVVVSRKF